MAEPRKLTLEELRAGMQVFLDFPDVEQVTQEDVHETVNRILLSKAENGGRDPVDVLTDYLAVGNVKDMEERLKVIIGLSRGSLERVKRIYDAVFPDVRWSRLRHDNNIRRRIARFLIYPEAEEVFIPPFIRSSFYLPANWIDLLQERNFLQAVVIQTKQSQYAVSMGHALEDRVGAIVTEAGYAYQKGEVGIVNNKQVDIAIPDTMEPRILIMSSYQLTTGSSQTTKASEQLGLFEDVRRYNSSRIQRNKPDVLFTNVVDGGGWLSRSKELQSLWRESDYCFSHSSLDGLQEVLEHYL